MIGIHLKALQARTFIRAAIDQGRRRLRSRSSGDVLALTMANGVTAALSLLQALIVARVLGPELYGVAVLVLAYPATVAGILDARSLEASVKYLAEFNAHGAARRALAVCKLGYAVDAGIALLASLFVLATARWAEDGLVGSAGIAWLLVAYAFAQIPASLAGTSWAVLSAVGEFSTIAAIEILGAAVRVGAVIGLVLAGYGVDGVVWGNVVSLVVHGVMFSVVAHRKARAAWGSTWIGAPWRALDGRYREIAGFLVYNDLSGLSALVFRRVDVLALGWLGHAADAGQYQIAKSFGSVVNYLGGPLQWTGYPRLAHLWVTSGAGSTYATIRRWTRHAVALAVPIGVVAVLVTPVLVPLLVGQEYRGAVPAARYFVAAQAAHLVFFWVRPFYGAQVRMREWLVLNAAIALVALAGYAPVIRIWGFSGLAAWVAFSYLSIQAIGAWRLAARPGRGTEIGTRTQGVYRK